MKAVTKILAGGVAAAALISAAPAAAQYYPGYGGYGGGYGGAYGGQPPVDLTFKCKTDYRGYIVDVDIDRARSNYGTNYQPYSPYGNDYSQYGYRRY
jgi:opacity protein-like surface antigen